MESCCPNGNSNMYSNWIYNWNEIDISLWNSVKWLSGAECKGKYWSAFVSDKWACADDLNAAIRPKKDNFIKTISNWRNTRSSGKTFICAAGSRWESKIVQILYTVNTGHLVYKTRAHIGANINLQPVNTRERKKNNTGGNHGKQNELNLILFWKRAK